MRKKLLGGIMLLCMGMPLAAEATGLTSVSPTAVAIPMVETEPVTLEHLFIQGQSLSSDYLMATYTYANKLLEVQQLELTNQFNWSVFTGDITYYWNDGDEPAFPMPEDVKASRLTASPGAIFNIPTTGTSVTVTTPFSVDFNTSENSTVTPGVQLTQDIITPKSYENQLTNLTAQQGLLSAESSITKALVQLEQSVLEAISDLFEAELAYKQALHTQKQAEINLQQVVDVLGYTEETTTYQEAVMATLQTEQATDLALFELSQAQDELELLTGYRSVDLTLENMPVPSPALDELRATTSLMATDIAVSMADCQVKIAEADTAFSLEGTFGANMTVGNNDVLDSNLTAGVNAAVGQGLTFGASLGTNLNKKDVTAGVNFTYTPMVNQHGQITLSTAQNSYLQAIQQRSLVETLYTSQQSQLKNQIALWGSSYDLALRRHEVAENQYEQEQTLYQEGYSTDLSLEEKALARLEAEHSVMQALMQGLLLERGIELFYNS